MKHSFIAITQSLATVLFLGTASLSYASGGGGGEHGDTAEPAPAVPVGPKRQYNPGTVEMFPTDISGVDLKTGKNFTYKVERGRVALVFFVASWCEPCQQLMPQLKNVAQKFGPRYTDVIYVFAHDTKDDASGFAKEHKLTGRMLLANHEILKSFKNPPLPSVYSSDRYTYMGNRFLKITPKEISELEDYLSKLTAL